ncbi:MAG TPA: tryptophan synthase subunit alpha [Deltaproteobacteria bacterium]|uniref:Tryptophan synthase alpha chain n=1 Tax=uncultured delta proteobacterium Rifle_16ft_4_minimus_184 TaxID=1665175 RepID=A0A0H4T1F5_9DELT|nr:tryptophan synthase subunit alpha TrpA [uncultured delta proteobacterium Rifle_16ft_4_minimus_184]OGP20694.1 MAG: tryptophan synthase subunit alpha [Deltaproteobacteria bacterium GWA2_65_63]OGP28242.1 MAG: tryptophan synthase subunit alpha [Deltaproteobacteria bacterium GWB2_65_81]OGP40331.1 MAG: tryptophan synthase subunit alpha [Deltaproteobacteria bacterium GWC2_66_88]OGP77978.1 MAG: tryptophan synthase subunit alpha [Deltaproteobacteria bacterium RBG_16_66_15]HAM33755.1 tryptophan synth
MTAIDAVFRRLRASGEKGLVVYLTAGDPTPSASLGYLRAAADAGADILEVGIPFSDPTADGPTIEAASRRALSSGMNVAGALELVRKFRKTHATPIVLFGYCNPFLRYGWSSLCVDAGNAGVDGFLVVDLPFEERGDALPSIRKAGLDWIPLAAPTSGMERIHAFDRAGSGFLYLISVTGVTGVRDSLPPEMATWTRKVAKATRLPVAVGFGISSPAMARAATRDADAAVVGSACVKIVEKNGRGPRGPAELSRFVRSLKKALR